jgi:hypothetical protein
MARETARIQRGAFDGKPCRQKALGLILAQPGIPEKIRVLCDV